MQSLHSHLVVNPSCLAPLSHPPLSCYPPRHQSFLSSCIQQTHQQTCLLCLTSNLSSPTLRQVNIHRAELLYLVVQKGQSGISLALLLQGAWVQSLVRDLRSHIFMVYTACPQAPTVTSPPTPLPPVEMKNQRGRAWSGEASDNQNKERGLPWWLSGKESTCQCRRHGFDP